LFEAYGSDGGFLQIDICDQSEVTGSDAKPVRFVGASGRERGSGEQLRESGNKK
jgi:hypothetical protein